MSADEELPMHVIDMIKSWIGRRDLNRSELARRLGVSHTWVSNRLAGHQELTLREVVRIAAALEVEVTELLPTAQPSRRYRPAAERPARDDSQVAVRPTPTDKRELINQTYGHKMSERPQVNRRAAIISYPRVDSVR